MPSQANATVVFSDIRDFTEFTAERGDVQALDLVKRHGRLADAAARAHAGRVIKSYGDGLMLRFAAPEHAVRAAMQLQTEANRFTQTNPSTPLLVGVGIHAGEMIEDGDDVFGLAVNLAKRFADEARSGQIIASQAVMDRLPAALSERVIALGQRPIKGFGQVELFEVIWRHEALRLTTRDQTLNLVLTHDDKLVIELGKHVRQELDALRTSLRKRIENPKGVMGWVLQRSEDWLPNLIDKALATLGIGIEHQLGGVKLWLEGPEHEKLLIQIGRRRFDLSQWGDRGFEPDELQAFLQRVQQRQRTLEGSSPEFAFHTDATNPTAPRVIPMATTTGVSPLRSFFIALSHNERVKRRFASWKLSRRLVRRFVAGERLEQALEAVRVLNQSDIFATLNLLGEETHSDRIAAQAKDAYVHMLEEIQQAKVQSTISLKPSQLGLAINPELCRRHLEEILDRAAPQGISVCLDMEGSAYTDATLALFEQLRQNHGNVSTVLQANLKRSEHDLARLIERGSHVRLVKGAYLEPSDIAHTSKSDVDKAFWRMIKTSLSTDALRSGAYVAIATHDARMLKKACELVRQKRVPETAYEFQMLYGIGRDLQQQLAAAGHVVRVYVSYGSEWYPYFMRRLAERPANVFFLLRNLLKG